jgi:hypothetical protein
MKLRILEAPKPVSSPVREIIRIFESLNVIENVADKPVAKPPQGLSNCIKLLTSRFEDVMATKETVELPDVAPVELGQAQYIANTWASYQPVDNPE